MVDLGGFYLDITKDRVYTCAQNSAARRSAQSAQYHIAQALVRWITPILSFTPMKFGRQFPAMLALFSPKPGTAFLLPATRLLLMSQPGR